MTDYKKQAKKRKEQFELLVSNYRNINEWIPHCCDKPLQPPHRAAATVKEFSWLCGVCGKYYQLIRN
jgi:hypothetical protein